MIETKDSQTRFRRRRNRPIVRYASACRLGMAPGQFQVPGVELIELFQKLADKLKHIGQLEFPYLAGAKTEGES